MAPVAVSSAPVANAVDSIKESLAKVSVSPVETGDFNIRDFAHFDSTSVIGTEFSAAPRDGKPVLDIRDVLKSDAQLKALGRLVSERGVVFFRNAIITPEEQKVLVSKIGEFGGKPASSGLHVHPLTPPDQEEGQEITVISSKLLGKRKNEYSTGDKLERRTGNQFWHSDITFEPIPSDYASLVIRTLPPVGGDTLWASAYEAYDRLSPALQTFLEGLTALHSGSHFANFRNDIPGFKFPEPRGSPENVGQDLLATHPIIRTNPVTGWKGLFVNHEFTRRIVELSATESAVLLKFLFDHVSANHDLQVRFRWEENSLAIWDNRSTFHAASPDLEGKDRVGTRSVSIGEKPYFDAKSSSRRDALQAAKEQK